MELIKFEPKHYNILFVFANIIIIMHATRVNNFKQSAKKTQRK